MDSFAFPCSNEHTATATAPTNTVTNTATNTATNTNNNTSNRDLVFPSDSAYPKLPIHDLLDLIDQVFASRSNSQIIQDDVPVSPMTMTATASSADVDLNMDAIVGSKRKYGECVTLEYESYGKELAEIFADEQDRPTSNQWPTSRESSDKQGEEETGNEAQGDREEMQSPATGNTAQPDQSAFQEYLGQVLKAQFSTVVGERCTYCPDRVFWRRHDLVRHIKTSHLMERPFECERCHNRFKRKSHLDIHIRAVHERLGSFPCKLCHKVYSSDSTRRKHIRTQHKCEDYD